MARSRRHRWVVCLLLAAATFAVHGTVLRNGFVSYDDGNYVFDNPNVRSGLTLPGIAWAFTTNEVANWHPLTWLSHMADAQLWGLKPAGHHVTGVLLHVLNAILLYLLLEKMTGASWRAAAAAALFALHPLRVESVAWVAERKDVLSTFLGLLCLCAYVRYVRRGRKAPYAWSLLLFSASLMAKPMLVTLPFLLLVLDYWPLGRMGDAVSAGERCPRPSARRLILEKTPFLLLAVASSAVTLWAQRRGGAMSALPLPVAVRIDNAVLSYARYLGKLLYPVHLAVLYPHPGVVQGVKTLAVGALLLAATALFVLLRRRIPYLLAGWLWYVGTLMPVIGLVQVGYQSMADRYTYFPSIGLVVMAVWGVSDLAARWPARRALLAGSTALVLCALSILTFLQIRHWKDSVSLFEHALQTTDRNAMIALALGTELLRQGRVAEGTLHLEEALRLNPDSPEAHYQLGALVGLQGHWAEAASHAQAALKLRPEFAEGHYLLGVALDSQGQTSEAIHHYDAALRLKPDYADAHNNLGKALLRQQKIPQAVAHFERWLKLEPTPQGHYDLALVLLAAGQRPGALAHLREAARLSPNWVAALEMLTATLATSEVLSPVESREGVQLGERVCQLTGWKDHNALDLLAAAQARAGDLEHAVATEQKAIDLAKASGAAEAIQKLQARLDSYKARRPSS